MAHSNNNIQNSIIFKSYIHNYTFTVLNDKKSASICMNTFALYVIRKITIMLNHTILNDNIITK